MQWKFYELGEKSWRNSVRSFEFILESVMEFAGFRIQVYSNGMEFEVGFSNSLRILIEPRTNLYEHKLRCETSSS